MTGETLAYPPETTPAEARKYWFDPPNIPFVGVADDGSIAGSYILRTNQPGRGSHVANAGYIVSTAHRGKGIGQALCEHSIEEARRRGFRAMQFNLVVSTNYSAVSLWRRCGFLIIGTIPEAFQHPTGGFVDAFVMHRFIGASTTPAT
jgi:ribosomal protein S18 acetylase RimI-like enzyme